MNQRHKQISDLILQKSYEAAELIAKRHVQEFPLDGQGWLLLGEALMNQDQGQAAQRLFDRALFLDPKGKWMPFMKREMENVNHSEAVSEEIEQLLSVPRVTVSAAIIVKDEERSIKRCIQSILHAVDEIIVVDSGSTDQTLSILKTFPQVKVFTLKWNDNFAELRNEALRHITSDWVFWLDADEWLHEEDNDLIRLAAGLYHNMEALIPALQPCLMNYVKSGLIQEYSVPRFFQMNRGIYYSGRIHEQIATEQEGIFTTNVLHKPIGIRLYHDGYKPEIKTQKDKATRNIKLLELMTEEDPTNPGWWYFLGRETMGSEDNTRAVAYFEKAIELGKSYRQFGRIAEIYMLQGKIHRSRNQLELAEEFFMKALAVHPDYPDAHFQLAHISTLKAQQLLADALKHVQEAASGFHTYRGAVAPDQDIHLWKADALRSDILVLNGHFAEGAAILQGVKAKAPHAGNIDRKLEFMKQQTQRVQQLFQ
ncbi:glycosyltransferase family 2 protein [Paenibacillus massiliensis]|uniref:glycosyltransferase family 2 protein n=1 Tax=Paenibacillus massiliensis TaxID=225917 RepID=UPI00041C6268|nr:glycosyltransferase family 2 protein [Paenibacillus massiliensis]